MTNRDTDNRGPVNRDPDNRDDFDNRKETALATSSLTGGAVASLMELGKTFNNVDTAAITRRSEMPILTFRSRERTLDDGQKPPLKTIFWGVNSLTFKRNLSFNDASGGRQKLLPVSLPMPVAELPTTASSAGRVERQPEVLSGRRRRGYKMTTVAHPGHRRIDQGGCDRIDRPARRQDLADRISKKNT
jgi:hypothetical protein